jgi:hypothetical protein
MTFALPVLGEPLDHRHVTLCSCDQQGRATFRVDFVYIRLARFQKPLIHLGVPHGCIDYRLCKHFSWRRIIGSTATSTPVIATAAVFRSAISDV